MKVEIRADSVILEGYVSAVERDSRPIPSPQGRFIERIRAGTFKKSLMRRKTVELRFNHRKKIGSTDDGSLELHEDGIGLWGRANVTDPEVIAKARNKELRGWSFGFFSNKDTWEDGADGMAHRTLEDIDMTEVSILDITPAYIATSIEERENEVIEKRSSEDSVEHTTDSTRYRREYNLLRLRGKKYEQKV